MMSKYSIFIISIFLSFSVLSQDGERGTTIQTNTKRTIAPAYRISSSPQLIDTTIASPVVNYPLLNLQEETAIELKEIQPANIRSRPQLPQLYRSFIKVGMGSKLQALGEVYVNSLRSRKYNWGVHALHHSEWGKLKDYAPSQYDNTIARAFGTIYKRRYSYGGELMYKNQGLHYYGFENPDASRDSIRQRYQTLGFNAFFDSHKKDSSLLNYRIGIGYNFFMNKKPKPDSLSTWRGREHNVALKSIWEYNGSSNKLLANLRADLDVSYNDYRYGLSDSVISPADTGFIQQNTVIHFRPQTHFYGIGEKLQFMVGAELAVDIKEKVKVSIYPLAEVSYSLFNDIFIPYAGIQGGLKQQRFQHLAEKNHFIHSNQQLKNERRYEVFFGFKGVLTSRISFNAMAKFGSIRDHVLFVQDTLLSSGNEFVAIYDTLRATTIEASISYQNDEQLKVDLIGRFHSYEAENNPWAWNLPQFEIITRGTYNIADKLIARIDFTLETGRRTRVYDTTLEGIKEQDGIYSKKLGVLADLNLGVEFRYSKRLSLFLNFNNIAAQDYKRWYNYPVNRFQLLGGITYRF